MRAPDELAAAYDDLNEKVQVFALSTALNPATMYRKIILRWASTGLFSFLAGFGLAWMIWMVNK